MHIRGHVFERHGQQASRRHCLQGIRYQIHDDLMDLSRVPHHRCPGRSQAILHRDMPRQIRRDQIERFTYDVLHVHCDPFAHPTPAECENAIDERTTAFASDHDAVYVSPQPSSGGHITKCHLTIAKDRAKQVVEIMGDAPRKGTYRL